MQDDSLLKVIPNSFAYCTIIFYVAYPVPIIIIYAFRGIYLCFAHRQINSMNNLTGNVIYYQSVAYIFVGIYM